MALAAHEGEELVKTLIYMERVGGGWTCAKLSEDMVTIMEAHHYINNHSTLGCPLVWLRTAANTTRVNQRVGKAWFTRFFIYWRHLISERKP